MTIRNVGPNGGQAAAFAYDLAKSIIYTRQGNPAWSGQARSGIFPFVETSDLFLGNAAGDPQPDWVDFSKIAIPQADEQQRLLANMLTEMEADQMPLPRLWYFPDGAKAIVIMTGDDHGIGGTNGRFDTYYNDDPSGGGPSPAPLTSMPLLPPPMNKRLNLQPRALRLPSTWLSVAILYPKLGRCRPIELHL